MLSSSERPSESGSKHVPITVGSFHFVSVQGPDEAQDKTKRRAARSHAVKQALCRKRKQLQENRDNFIVTKSTDHAKKNARKPKHIPVMTGSILSLSAGMLDPFQSLALDSTRLQALLGDYKARQSAEPVFTFAEDMAFHSFHSVFRTGMVDPAVLNAVMLTFTFAVTECIINQECLRYQGQALSHIRQRMASLDQATSESTIGAILLLAGVEARLGMSSQVQLHMGAVKRLLETCRTEGVHLTGGIKRAIFWQDLNSSILSGSRRIVDHTTFPELHWSRDLFSPDFFHLPPGFLTRSHLFTREFMEVLEDVQALQRVRDVGPPSDYESNAPLLARINNHIASIQSRLVDLMNLCPALECVRLATYLCSVMLTCRVWCALTIPAHVSSQLLRMLQQCQDDFLWDDHPELLLWLLYIGGAFTEKPNERSGYIALLRSNNRTRFGDLNSSWSRLLEILKQFIWSKRAFARPVELLWVEAFRDDGPISLPIPDVVMDLEIVA
ncbi:hypothetical protein GE09DRAFT_619527 [Coniochaeta sp. 2T2.1]|nr:hypothetical protein GE09DRAFT_619527 [Coniochaeta sp. 2T2.1]